MELNQRYVSLAVIPDDDAAPERWLRDPELYHQATTRPGAKLPHAWLVGADGRRVSTLDLVGKGKFSLMTGLSGEAWQAASAAVNCPVLRLVVVGTDEAQDPYQAWAAASEVEESGALLVRPDGIVAWRVRTGIWDGLRATAMLRSALRRLAILSQQ